MNLLIALSLLGCILVASHAQILGKDVPPFLHHEDESALHSWHKLMETNEKHTDAEIDTKVVEWVKKQSPKIQASYHQFYAELKAQEEQMAFRHEQSIKKFSPEARKADEELWGIAHDPKLNMKEKSERIQSIIKKLPKAVKEEIEKEMS